MIILEKVSFSPSSFLLPTPALFLSFILYAEFWDSWDDYVLDNLDFRIPPILPFKNATDVLKKLC